MHRPHRGLRVRLWQSCACLRFLLSSPHLPPPPPGRHPRLRSRNPVVGGRVHQTRFKLKALIYPFHKQTLKPGAFKAGGRACTAAPPRRHVADAKLDCANKDDGRGPPAADRNANIARCCTTRAASVIPVVAVTPFTPAAEARAPAAVTARRSGSHRLELLKHAIVAWVASSRRYVAPLSSSTQPRVGRVRSHLLRA